VADPEVADPVVDPRDKSKDRYLEVSGNQPSPHNMGWYKDLNAAQRYAVIVIAYLEVAAAIDSREPDAMQNTVDDMALWVIGNAPADQEAIRAGREYYQDIPGYMARVHRPIFGTGYSDFYAFESPDIPRIPELPEGKEVGEYSSRMLLQLSDDPGRPRTFNYQYDYGNMGSMFLDGLRSAPEEVGGLMDALSIDPERNEGDGLLLRTPTRVDYPTFMPEPKADDLFRASMGSRHGPEYSVAWQNTLNMGGNIPGIMLDAVILGGAAKSAFSTIGEVGQAGMKAVPAGPRSWITNALVHAKSFRVPGTNYHPLGGAPSTTGGAPKLSMRRKIGAGNLAVAGTSTVAAWARDYFDKDGLGDISGLTPDTQDWLNEVYHSRDGTATKFLDKATSALDEYAPE
jgi:hypothetical protein